MLPCFLFSLPFASHFFTHWQVKLPSLHDYLLSMRRRGYALVGAEQTANSKDIVNFNFRPNTILILRYTYISLYVLLPSNYLIFQAIVRGDYFQDAGLWYTENYV